MIKIDNRDRQDILEELQKRARAYTPEWKFDTIQPDAASVIGLIFSHQMMENVIKRNQVWEKYRIAFANMYGVSRKPAVPAKTICTLKVSESVQGGVALPKGTQVIGTTDAGEEVLFSFSRGIYATNTELTDIFETSDRFSLFPDSLFAEKKRPFRRQAVVMCFQKFSDMNFGEQQPKIRFRGTFEAVSMAELFTDKAYFSLSAAVGTVDLNLEKMQTSALEVRKSNDGWIEIEDRELLPIASVSGEEMTVLVLEMRKPPAEKIGYQNLFIDTIELFAARQSVQPDFVRNEREETAAERFLPFTEQPALYDECFIGQNFLFEQQGATVTLRFRLEFGRYRPHKPVSVPPDLRIVRRKPRKDEQKLQYECRVQEVSFAYFNGKGWRRLTTNVDVTTLFAREENAGEYQITFVVPNDWERVMQDGYEGKCIRMQVLRAENCYLQNVEYIYPILSEVMLCMEEQKCGIAPIFTVGIQGTKAVRVQDRLKQNAGFCAFLQSQYQGDYLYLGFDRAFGERPVSLFVELEKSAAWPGVTLSFAYPNTEGFQPLKIVDETNGLQNSGLLMFAPPIDMVESIVDDMKRYWLRVQIQSQGDTPVIKKIYINAVTAENTIAKEEQDYYIDTVKSDMRFPLYAENILSVQVWVNEKEQLTKEEMAQLEASMETRVEYNFLGEVEDFYVLWHEVENFAFAAPMERCYCVDRGSNELIFGDGVFVRIPQNITSIAFKTNVLCCDGEKANIKAGKIDRFRGTVISVEQVVNPIDAYGGTDLERLQHALKRGCDTLASQRRMVTEQDYIREALAFSDMVTQAACVSAQDGVIRLVLLMRDYQKGTYSFRRVQQPLREHLVECCEAACGRDWIQVCLPVFVKISVQIWLDLLELSKSIEIRQCWHERIMAFLEPVNVRGEIQWKFGKLPRTGQIRLMLNTLTDAARIVHMNVLAEYVEGTHTFVEELDKVVANPFMICTNGTHKIYTGGQKD